MPDNILVLQVIVLLCGTTAFVASLRFLRRVLELRHERQLHAPSDALQQRMERIESTVESTAIEVERISEANRFIAKMLDDRAPKLSVPGQPPRVITPH
jgi:hypothetical protein